MTVAGRILVTGVNGQVGGALLPRLEKAGYVPLAAPRQVLDLAAPAGLKAALSALRPDILVNCAAYTAVDQAETDRETAFAVNAEAPGAMAEWCREHRVPMLHLSTDYVFPGDGVSPYREDDPTGPLGVYGASKLAGEEAVRAAAPLHVILRTAWVYAATGKNFVRTMLRLGAERDALRVVADQRGCPTAASNIAAAILAVLPRLTTSDPSVAGTYHYVDAGETTWHGLAEAIFAAMAPVWGRRPAVEAIATADYKTPARRPAYSVLDTAKFRGRFGVTPPSWQDSLNQTLTELAR